ncbi:MAG TPA: ABC transporter permease [Gemmataceae bacterium]|jgi:ABC-type Na+ efflux pump permease subunit
MPVWNLAIKDLRLLVRDTRAAVIMLAMPLVFILVLGMALGENFGQKPDDRLRVSVVVLDEGLPDYPPKSFPGRPWSDVVLDDLGNTAGIRVERIQKDGRDDRPTAERLVRRGERSAVLVFGPDFSRRVQRCSFLADRFLKEPGVNPFYRDGVNLAELDVDVLIDPTQRTAASIIEQVAQVTMLRVVMPWMIGRAFDEVTRQLPLAAPILERLFAKYDLRAKTWAQLTKQTPRPVGSGAVSQYQGDTGAGALKRGAVRYQILVPSYTVMFAFFLVLTVGWLFVAERRQGTMLRLRAAPLSRGQILLGKLIPCYLLSIGQGLFLLAAGKLVFGMSWGPNPGWLLVVAAATSFAAVGLAMLVASVARTETQVAIYGTLLVLVLAGVSGCLMPRELMPEDMRTASLVTPHAWALDAYSQLLINPAPELGLVAQACGVLVGFGLAYLLLAWLLLRLD